MTLGPLLFLLVGMCGLGLGIGLLLVVFLGMMR